LPHPLQSPAHGGDRQTPGLLTRSARRSRELRQAQPSTGPFCGRRQSPGRSRAPGPPPVARRTGRVAPSPDSRPGHHNWAPGGGPPTAAPSRLSGLPRGARRRPPSRPGAGRPCRGSSSAMALAKAAPPAQRLCAAEAEATQGAEARGRGVAESHCHGGEATSAPASRPAAEQPQGSQPRTPAGRARRRGCRARRSSPRARAQPPGPGVSAPRSLTAVSQGQAPGPAEGWRRALGAGQLRPPARHSMRCAQGRRDRGQAARAAQARGAGPRRPCGGAGQPSNARVTVAAGATPGPGTPGAATTAAPPPSCNRASQAQAPPQATTGLGPLSRAGHLSATNCCCTWRWPSSGGSEAGLSHYRQALALHWIRAEASRRKLNSAPCCYAPGRERAASLQNRPPQRARAATGLAKTGADSPQAGRDRRCAGSYATAWVRSRTTRKTHQNLAVVSFSATDAARPAFAQAISC